ncbi:MAG: zinc ribbon domain-containing protein [Anaerolineae bacterium]
MRNRPGRTSSILSGIFVLIVMGIGLYMMRRSGGFNGVPTSFLLLWVLFGLFAAGRTFYRAFRRDRQQPHAKPERDREVETERVQEDAVERGRYCPECGEPVGDDRFCSNCGAPLSV